MQYMYLKMISFFRKTITLKLFKVELDRVEWYSKCLNTML